MAEQQFDPSRAMDLIKSRKRAEGSPEQEANRTIVRQKLLDLQGALSRLLDIAKKNPPEGAKELAEAADKKMAEVEQNEYRESDTAKQDIKEINEFMAALSDENLAEQGIDPSDPGAEIVGAKAGATARVESIQDALGKLSILRAETSDNIDKISELVNADQSEILALQSQIETLLDDPAVEEAYTENAEMVREKNQVEKIFSYKAMPLLESFIHQTDENGKSKEVSSDVIREALYLLIKGEADRLGAKIGEIDSQTITGTMEGLTGQKTGYRGESRPTYTSFLDELRTKDKIFGTGSDSRQRYDRGVLIGAALRQIFKTGYNDVSDDFRDLIIALGFNEPDMTHNPSYGSVRPDLPPSSKGIMNSQMGFMNFVKAAREGGALGVERPDRPYANFEGLKIVKGEPIVESNSTQEEQGKAAESYQIQRERIQDIVVAEHVTSIDKLKAGLNEKYSESIDRTMRTLNDRWRINNGEDAPYPLERVRAIIVEFMADIFAAMKIPANGIVNRSYEVQKILDGVKTSALFDTSLTEASRDADQYSRIGTSSFALGISLRDAITMENGERPVNHAQNSSIAEMIDAVTLLEGSTANFATNMSESDKYYNVRTARRVISSVLPTMNLIKASDTLFDGGLKNKFGDPKSRKMLEISGFKIEDDGAIIPSKDKGEYPAPYITPGMVEQIKADYRETKTRTAGEAESVAESKRQTRIVKLRQTQELYDSVLAQGDIFATAKGLNQELAKKQAELENLPEALKNAVRRARAACDALEGRNFIKKMSRAHKDEVVAAEKTLDVAVKAQINPESVRTKLESEKAETEEKLRLAQAEIAKLPSTITSKKDLENARAGIDEEISGLSKK